MVNWNNAVTLETLSNDYSKLQHALGGLYVWEIVTNLPYDWKLVTNTSRGVPLVKWIYLTCRYLTLAAIMTILTFADVTTAIDCKILVIFAFAFAFFATQLASLLIAIRVLAIWNFKRQFVYVVALFLCTQLGSFIHTLTQIDAIRQSQDVCSVLHTQTSLAAFSVTFAVDLFLSVSMLAGLLRWEGASRFGLWKVLWGQGLLWLTLATIAEVPTVVLLALNLNGVFNIVFFTPEMIILVIGATRMYRTLSEYTKSYRPNSEYINPGILSDTRSQTRLSQDISRISRRPFFCQRSH